MNDAGAGEPGRRAEIDGLRAVAVLVVVLFHADLGFPGGYVGVDVFFVLSGFLVTRLIWLDLRAGRFSLARFFERRARRILPALALVTLATLAAGWLLLLPDEYADLGRSAAAQALLGANVHFWRTVDYFSRPAEQQPLLHTWSLSLEEQFYLLIPFLLLAVFRLRSRRRPVVAIAVLGVLLAGSFTSSVAGVARLGTASFYLLPDRAWEFLLGSAVALLPAGGLATRRALHEALGWLGLALVVLPALAYDERTPFPGLAALPPCAGTALFLWSNATSRNTAGKLLSLRPLVIVGLLSYSLYLWHWPLLAFGRVWSLGPLSLTQRAVLLAAALVLAALSWHLVEQPFRARRAAHTSRAFATWTTVALATILAWGVVVGARAGLPGRFAPDTLAPLAARADRAFQRNVSLADAERGDLVRFGDDDPKAPGGWLVWGDSHAMAALPAFDALAKERGRAGEAALHVSTAPLLGFVRESRKGSGLRDEAPRHAAAILRHVRERGIRDVVLIANWSGYRNDAGGPSAAKLADALVATVEAVVRSGARAWVLLQIPKQPFDVPSALARARASGGDVAAACARPDGSNGVTGNDDPTILQRIAAAGGRVLDPRPHFLDPTGRSYVVSLDGVPLYADTHHLTAAGARLTLLPLLRTALD